MLAPEQGGGGIASMSHRPLPICPGMDVLGHQVDFVGWPHIIIARVPGLVDWRKLLCLEGGFRLGLEQY